MSTAPLPDVAPHRAGGRTPGRARAFAAAYAVLALLGLVGTWHFNLRYTGGDYLGDWFANDASSSAAVDLLVLLSVAVVLYVSEGRRLRYPWWWLAALVVLSVVVALSFALPLFLAARELRLARPTASAGVEVSAPAP